MINLLGYDKLGAAEDEGIRFAWSSESSNVVLESASFINRAKNEESNICAYTTSVSIGCILRQFNKACVFCMTGMKLPFVRLLTAKEIAKQNILMVLLDMHCDDHKSIVNNKREFAYMGQGEPGYSYPQVRIAIKITDIAMGILGQDVHRHIVSTSGIYEMIDSLHFDLQNNYFNSRITVHYSLHNVSDRAVVMPIETMYGYKDAIAKLGQISCLTNEKICLGLLLFNNFRPMKSDSIIKTTIDDLLPQLSMLPPEKFRFSLSEFNKSEDLGIADVFSEEEAIELKEALIKEGYETKLFNSFGRKEETACGMLAGKKPKNFVSSKWRELELYAESMVADIVAKHNL